MKEYKNNIFSKILELLNKKYRAPEECKLFVNSFGFFIANTNNLAFDKICLSAIQYGIWIFDKKSERQRNILG